MKRIFFPFILCIFLFSYIYAQDKLFFNTFPLDDVVLLDGLFKRACDLNVQTLLKYNVDRFLAPYLKIAGLKPKAQNYPSWESMGLDGHMAGHYLSAMAIHYAATGNPECKQRLEYMISELKACQDANAIKYPDWGNGYVGGVPNSHAIWSNFKKGDFSQYRSAWVPWYNLHKMYAGLRDAWLYANNEEAKTIFLKFCDWAISITSNLSDAQMESMLGTEHGGMNEIFVDAYQMTGDERYLIAAKRFSHKELLNAMALGYDNLDNKHANTQIPKVVGFQRIAEFSGDPHYANAARFFWETVTQNRSLAFGGNSRSEHFPSASACMDYVTGVEGPESCNTYNMLKLTEHLFRAIPLAKYADFYEKALYNHILSTQHPGHGGYVYFTPVRPRHYRVYSAPNLAMWCCVGTGMENHGKYGQFIYTHQKDSLFLNLFIASELNWREKGIRIKQETQFPFEEKTRLTVTEGSSHFILMIRYPSWVASGAFKILLNGDTLSYTGVPSSYIPIDRTWAKGDVIEVILPMSPRIEQLPNVPQYIAFLYGPIVLGAKTGTEDLRGLIADASRWAHISSGMLLPLEKAPIIVEDDCSQIPNKLVPIPGKPLHFTAPELNIVNAKDSLEFEPFCHIHDSRYMMYWMALTHSQYQAFLDSISAGSLENRTIDSVATGVTQSEQAHAIRASNSYSGTHMGEFWRDARNGGYFSYRLYTNGETHLSLMVRYWGNEYGNRTFDILVDNVKLVTENISGKWNVSEFRNVEYIIPDSMVRGKDTIRVKFQAPSNGYAGGVFFIRLLRQRSTEVKQSLAPVRSFQLHQNYPNPFNSRTTIQFDLPKSSKVSLEVYDLVGRSVVTLLNRELEPGPHVVDFDASHLASGVYVYSFKAGEFSWVKKFVLIK